MDSFNKRAARVISNLLSLPLVATSVVIVFSFFSPRGLGSILTPLKAILLGIPTIAVAPIVMVLYFFRKGYVDLHVSQGERRPIFFIPALAAYVSAAVVFLWLQCKILYLLSVSYLSISLIVLIVTLFWKISIHMAGLTGPITALTLALGANYALLYLLADISFSKRLLMRSRTRSSPNSTTESDNPNHVDEQSVYSSESLNECFGPSAIEASVAQPGREMSRPIAAAS